LHTPDFIYGYDQQVFLNALKTENVSDKQSQQYKTRFAQTCCTVGIITYVFCFYHIKKD